MSFHVRRAMAPIEMILVLPVFGLLFLSIMFAGMVFVAQGEVIVEARWEATQQVDGLQTPPDWNFQTEGDYYGEASRDIQMGTLASHSVRGSFNSIAGAGDQSDDLNNGRVNLRLAWQLARLGPQRELAGRQQDLQRFQEDFGSSATGQLARDDLQEKIKQIEQRRGEMQSMFGLLGDAGQGFNSLSSLSSLDSFIQSSGSGTMNDFVFDSFKNEFSSAVDKYRDIWDKFQEVLGYGQSATSPAAIEQDFQQNIAVTQAAQQPIQQASESFDGDTFADAQVELKALLDEPLDLSDEATAERVGELLDKLAEAQGQSESQINQVTPLLGQAEQVLASADLQKLLLKGVQEIQSDTNALRQEISRIRETLASVREAVESEDSESASDSLQRLDQQLATASRLSTRLSNDLKELTKMTGDALNDLNGPRPEPPPIGDLPERP
jgi:hypothetical protein